MIQPKTSVKRLVVAVGAVSTLLGGVAAAQANEEKLILEEVVVTAQKREQNLQDVPISVNVVGGDSINNFNMQDFTEVKDLVPNLYIASTPGNYRIVMRGFGSGAGNFAFEQSVGLFIDGVYAGRARQYQAPFLDIERIEVLRGPQSTLFGKNTPAGAVSITTAKPTDQFEAQIRGDVEFEYGGYAVDGFVSGPLTDNLSARLTAKYADTDGHLENIGTGNDDPQTEEQFLRGTVVWTPGDTWEVIAKLEGGNKDITGLPFVNQAPGQDVKDADEKRNTGGIIKEDTDDSDSYNATLTINKDIGEHTLTSITSFSDYDYERIVDSDFGPAPLLATSFQEDFNQFSQELRIASPLGERIDYLAGIYYQTNELDMDQYTVFNFGPFNGTTFRDYHQETDNFAVFGQATWHINDSWHLTGGLRYTEEDKDADQVNRAEGITPPINPNGLKGSRSEDQVDPAVNLQFDVSNDIMLYAGYASGSKAGGFVGGQGNITQAEFEYDKEESESYELGAKMSLLDGAANMNIALYRTEFTDMQVSTFIGGEGIGFLTGNAAEATSQGIEIDGVWRITQALTVSGSFAYTDAEFDDYPGAPCPVGNTICDPATNNAKGLALAFAPEYSASINFDYYQPVSDTLEFGALLGINYSDEVRVDEAEDELGDQTQDSYTKINARISLASMDGRWELAIYGKNLTDELTMSQSFGTPAAPAGSSFTKLADPGRTIGVQGIMRF